MKSMLGYFTVFIMLVVVSYSQNVGIGTPTPDNSALLELNSTNKGFLMTRISLTGTNDNTTIPTPAIGLLVYNTNTTTGANAVSPGFYYWDGTQWVRLRDTESNDWTLTGNAGTDPTINFLGTTDAQDLAFRTNNVEHVRITSTGNVGIGTASPGALLDVRTINWTPTVASNTIRSYSGALDIATQFSTTYLASHGFAVGTNSYVMSLLAYNYIANSTTHWIAGISVHQDNSQNLSAGIYVSPFSSITVSGNNNYPTVYIGEIISGGHLSPTPISGFGTFLSFDGIEDQSDPIVMVRYDITSDQCRLRLYLEDNADNSQGFQILGRSCASGCYNLSNSSLLFEFNTDGNAYKPGGGNWAAISDIKTKNIHGKFSDGLNVLLNVNPIIYSYKPEYINMDRKYIGVIAQEIEKIAPYMVDSFLFRKIGDEHEEVLTVDPSAFTYILINAVKELYYENQKLKQEIKQLSNRLEKIENKLSQLEEK